LIKPIFSRQWIFTTILAIIAAGVMVRLGFWQLDRLASRRALNERILAQVDASPLNLDSEFLADDIDLCMMEYRKVEVRGEYAHSQQVSWRNQVYQNRVGVSLLTPLVIQGAEQAILVNRGWIPAEDASPENWAKYDEDGEVIVIGVLRCSQTEQIFNVQPDPTHEPGQTALEAWNYININQISQQVDLELLSVYIHQYPGEGLPHLPVRSVLDIEVTEGPHLSYTIQWFGFAGALLIGYPLYVRNQTKKDGENID
jgi:surfeit locus 1 family protein